MEPPLIPYKLKSFAKEDDDRSISIASSIGLMDELRSDAEVEPDRKKEEGGRRGGGKKRRVTFQEVVAAEAGDDSVLQTEEIDDQQECRACMVGGYFNNGYRSEFTDSMAKLIQESSRSMSWAHLINNIWDLGEKEREYILATYNKDIGEWTKEQIRYHLLNCMTDLYIWTLHESQIMKHLMDRLRNRWFEQEEGDEEIIANEKYINIYFKAQDQYKKLLIVPQMDKGSNPQTTPAQLFRPSTASRLKEI